MLKIKLESQSLQSALVFISYRVELFYSTADKAITLTESSMFTNLLQLLSADFKNLCYNFICLFLKFYYLSGFPFVKLVLILVSTQDNIPSGMKNIYVAVSFSSFAKIKCFMDGSGVPLFLELATSVVKLYKINLAKTISSVGLSK